MCINFFLNIILVLEFTKSNNNFVIIVGFSRPV